MGTTGTYIYSECSTPLPRRKLLALITCSFRKRISDRGFWFPSNAVALVGAGVLRVLTACLKAMPLTQYSRPSNLEALLGAAFGVEKVASEADVLPFPMPLTPLPSLLNRCLLLVNCLIIISPLNKPLLMVIQICLFP